MKKKKKDSTTIAMIIFVAVVFVFSVIYFLAQRNCDQCPSGWQILGMKGVSFWVWAIVLTANAAVVTVLVLRHLRKSGGVGVSLGVLIPVAVFLAIAWGGVCTDKANNGVTSEKFKPTGPANDGRVPAEELLKK